MLSGKGNIYILMLFILYSCCNKKNINNGDEIVISRIFWNEYSNKNSKGKILQIIKSKDTKLFKYYLVNLEPKPVSLPLSLKNHIKIVDTNTLYFDLANDFGHNTNELEKKGMIRIVAGNINQVSDENYSGTYYIFKKNGEELYLKANKTEFMSLRYERFLTINDDSAAYDSVALFLGSSMREK